MLAEVVVVAIGELKLAELLTRLFDCWFCWLKRESPEQEYDLCKLGPKEKEASEVCTGGLRKVFEL